MADAILVLNAGSSSIKFSLFTIADDQLALNVRGQVEGLYTAPKFSAKDAAGAVAGERSWDSGTRLDTTARLNISLSFCAPAALNTS